MEPPRLPTDAAAAFAALGNAQRLAIAAHLQNGGPASFTELCKVAKRKPGATAPHLAKLQRGGILRRVVAVRDGTLREAYDLTAFGQRLLEHAEKAYNPVEVTAANSRIQVLDFANQSMEFSASTTVEGVVPFE